MIPIRPILLRPFVAYNADHKKAFKLAAKAFLRGLASALMDRPLKEILSKPHTGYDLRWNEGGIAVSGEATLHTDDLYVQVSQSLLTGRPDVLYRSCRSSTDYCGNQNNTVDFRSLLTQEQQDRFINHCKALQAAEQARRRAS